MTLIDTILQVLGFVVAASVSVISLQHILSNRWKILMWWWDMIVNMRYGDDANQIRRHVVLYTKLRSSKKNKYLQAFFFNLDAIHDSILEGNYISDEGFRSIINGNLTEYRRPAHIRHEGYALSILHDENQVLQPIYKAQSVEIHMD